MLRVRETVHRSISDRTKRAYAEGWVRWEAWCGAEGIKPKGATEADVALFLRAQADAGFSLATILQRVAAISFYYRGEYGKDSPTQSFLVRRVIAGLRRELGAAQKGKKALRGEHLVKMVPWLSTRDKAIMLFGFATGLRRSELAVLTANDLKVEPRGVLVRLGVTKTDQEGQGTFIGVHRGKNPATCPVRAIEDWLSERSVTTPTLFGLSGKGIADVVKRAVHRIDLNPGEYAGHSLRAGMVTEADAQDAPRSAIRRQGRWKSDKMLDRYTRPEDAFETNLTEYLGL